MSRTLALIAAATLLSSGGAAAQAPAPTDAQIAHIAYTAGKLDIAAGRQALEKSKDPAVRAFAETMVRDHAAVNRQALALVKKLGVTPQDNPTSQALTADAQAKLKAMSALQGAAFDQAYVRNEVAFHQTVNGALQGTLIPGARNGELKDLLQTGLALFREHQGHAEQLSKAVRP